MGISQSFEERNGALIFVRRSISRALFYGAYFQVRIALLQIAPPPFPDPPHRPPPHTNTVCLPLPPPQTRLHKPTTRPLSTYPLKALRSPSSISRQCEKGEPRLTDCMAPADPSGVSRWLSGVGPLEAAVPRVLVLLLLLQLVLLLL